MAIETLEDPKPMKRSEWRCCNKECEALLAGTKRDALCISYKDAADQYEFECPHCSWRTTVPQ